MKKLFIIFAAVATLAACGTRKAEKTECSAKSIEVITLAPADLAGEWRIEKVGETVTPAHAAFLYFYDERYSATVGCNRISGTWLFTDSLVLTDGLSTKMYCEGLMELEQELCISLPEVKKAVSYRNGKVALQNAKGKTLLVIEKMPPSVPLPLPRPEQED